MSTAQFSIDHVIEKLKHNNSCTVSDPRFKPSAVLVLLVPTSTGYSIVITARSRKLNHHSGEMAFPGGKFDAEVDENYMQTALRETYEEVGIAPDHIRIIGTLDDFPTISNFIIRPFVGVLLDSDLVLIPNPGEVEAVIQIPVELLLKPDTFTEFPFPDKESKYSLLSMMYTDPASGKKYNVWGATAHLLSEYLRVIYGVKVRSGEYIRPTNDEIHQYRAQRKKKNQTSAKKMKNT